MKFGISTYPAQTEVCATLGQTLSSIVAQALARTTRGGPSKVSETSASLPVRTGTLRDRVRNPSLKAIAAVSPWRFCGGLFTRLFQSGFLESKDAAKRPHTEEQLPFPQRMLPASCRQFLKSLCGQALNLPLCPAGLGDKK